MVGPSIVLRASDAPYDVYLPVNVGLKRLTIIEKRTKMYDLSENIDLVIPSPDGEKICSVRQPTADEWITRFKTRINIIRNLGNGVTQSDVQNREKADMALLAAIQQNKEVVFDEAEAVTVIDQLATCDVVNVEKVGKSYEITLQTILGDVTHTVRSPYHKELKKTTDAIVKARGGRFNTTTLHMDIAPAAELYDSHIEKIEGYNIEDKALIPLVHKYKVIDVLQGEISNITVKSKVAASENFPQAPGQTVQA